MKALDINETEINVGDFILYAYPSCRRAFMRYGIVKNVDKDLIVRGYKKTRNGHLGYVGSRCIIIDRSQVPSRVINWFEEYT